METPSSEQRGSWQSRAGFVLAAAGSAIGLGNIWKFPYVTGRNGGGLFVLFYLFCVALVALPIMVAEIVIGRATQRSPIAAFRHLRGSWSAWTLTGWMGVLAGFVILSYYCVVAGWTVYYTIISFTRGFAGLSSAAIDDIFERLLVNGPVNVGVTALFMLATIAVVVGGVQAGIERWSRILMPLLFIMLAGLVIYGMMLPGRTEALHFMFDMRADRLSPAGLLEGMGQAFFSMSLGMGALITYGSYLPKGLGIIKSSLWVAVLDTAVALLASIVVFPVTFSYGIAPTAGPGLVFKSLPLAFSQLAGGRLLAIVFFALLVFAALTSAISLLEVVVSTLIDSMRWSRRAATLATGVAAFVLAVPSALSQGDFFGLRFIQWTGRNFFDVMENVSSNWMLPFGGLLTAIYVGWTMPAASRADGLGTETGAALTTPVLLMLRWLAPLAVLLVMLKTTGVLQAMGVGF